ncbi:MAG: histone deacetylase family protein [Candidatus Riflebacteria bacterium]|nr:histone deacetylase family protein [Candidatus Riflebacteria bacterium]
MKIIFNEEFKNSGYASDNAATPGRMEAAMLAFSNTSRFQIQSARPASESDILLAHTERRLLEVKENQTLYHIAALAAGAAVEAAELACLNNEPIFACLRPPGHHASKNAGWGYCTFCNIAIALLSLREKGLIKNAFVLDFDAHTGDGTIDILKDWPEVSILNPYADTNIEYIKLLEERLNQVGYMDVVAVSAGFDAYIHDAGQKLETFDFYLIGRLVKKMTKRFGHNKRFAILEGGYYLPDLGKNILAFCDGFE